MYLKNMPTTPIIDLKNCQWEYKPQGHLYIKQDPDQAYIPKFGKIGDAGLDLPVKINIDHMKFGKETPDKLRFPMLYPQKAYCSGQWREFVFPDGVPGDSRPCVDIPPEGWAEIPSGLSVKLPDDSWGFLKSRSGSCWHHHIIIIESCIDNGWIGELGTLVYNPTHYPVRVYEYDPKTGKGNKLAQLIIVPKYHLNAIMLVDHLPHTSRGKTGFGSSDG